MQTWRQRQSSLPRAVVAAAAPAATRRPSLPQRVRCPPAAAAAAAAAAPPPQQCRMDQQQRVDQQQQQQQQHARRPVRCRASVNRRDVVLLGAGGLLGASSSAAASDDASTAAAGVAGDAAAVAQQQPPAGFGDGAGPQPPPRPAPAGRKKRRRAAPPKAPAQIPRVLLAPGLEVSRVVRGCWQLDGQHRGDPATDRTAGGAAIEDLDAACRAGVTALDTADNYGPSEAVIGQHLRLNPGAAARTRVLTKLSFMAPPDAAELRRESIEYRVRSSIARLGVTTLDLVQLHWEPPPPPGGYAAAGGKRGGGNKGVPGFVAAAKALHELKERGLVRAVGVTNFDVPMLMALLDAGLPPPACNQVAFSLADRRPALLTARFCEERGVKLLAYGTLAGGFLTDRYLGLPASSARIDTVSKARYGNLLRQLGGWAWLQDVLRVAHGIGLKHGVPAACVATRWVLQQPGVAAAVIGARNSAHVRDWQRLFAFELDEGDLFDLDAVYEGANPPTSDVYAWERGAEW